MEKKEYPKKGNELKKATQEKEVAKPHWISDRVFDIIKLVLGISFLPFVYSSTVSFLKQLVRLDHLAVSHFWYGLITFLVIYLFVWEAQIVYNAGHKVLEFIFSFFQPLVKVAPYLLPVYVIVIFLIYLVLAVFVDNAGLVNITMFLFGLSFILHLTFSSRAIRSKKGDMLKSNYIFGFSFIYIVNLGLLAFILNVIFRDFSFVNFCNNSYAIAVDILERVFSQLFAV